jgi:thioredoxin-related protein
MNFKRLKTKWFMYSKFLVAFLLIISVIACGKKVKEPSLEENKVSIHLNNWNQMSVDATAKDQNMFLMLHDSWCNICNTFKNDILTEESVGNMVNNKIVVGLIDGDKDYGKLYMNRYNANGFPSFLILDKNGNELARKSGGLGKSDFFNWINPFLK